MGSFGQTSLKLKISCKCTFKLTEVESSLPDIPPLNLPVLYSSEACAIRWTWPEWQATASIQLLTLKILQQILFHGALYRYTVQQFLYVLSFDYFWYFFIHFRVLNAFCVIGIVEAQFSFSIELGTYLLQFSQLFILSTVDILMPTTFQTDIWSFRYRARNTTTSDMTFITPIYLKITVVKSIQNV